MTLKRTIYLDFGLLGEEVPVTVTAEWHEGRRGTFDGGQQIEPDEPAGWDVQDVVCGLVPTIEELYRTDDQIRDAIDELMNEWHDSVPQH